MSRDPGRQPERTRLAWRRTMLAVTVVALLATRMALRAPDGAGRPLLVAAVLAGWLAMLVLSWRRIAAMAAVAPRAARRVVPMTTLAVIGYALLGAAMVVTW